MKTKSQAYNFRKYLAATIESCRHPLSVALCLINRGSHMYWHSNDSHYHGVTKPVRGGHDARGAPVTKTDAQ